MAIHSNGQDETLSNPGLTHGAEQLGSDGFRLTPNRAKYAVARTEKPRRD
jgi:hypothetical protein